MGGFILKRNKEFPDAPYIEIFGGTIALWLRSIALHPARRLPNYPKAEMSRKEEKCFDEIFKAAHKEAEQQQLRMSLSGYEHSEVVDEWLRFNGFTIVNGESNQYLEW